LPIYVGADVHYNFGKIETSGLVFVTDIPVGTRQLNRATLSVDYSVVCTAKINKKPVFSSVSYRLESDLT
jgi:hypothetical protein